DMSTSSKQKSATAHLWVLDPVVRELQDCPVATARDMAELMNVRNVSILTSKNCAAARKFRHAYNGSSPGMSVVPALERTKTAPYLQPEFLKKSLMSEQMPSDEIVEMSYYPGLDSNLDAGEIARELVEQVNNKHYAKISSTLNFHSEALDRYLKPHRDANIEENTFYASPKGSAFIMPCGVLLPLEASALTSNTSIHLLSGMRIYLVYPPTLHNMVILHTHFQHLGNGSKPYYVDVCRQMEGGIIFIQRPGEVVRLRPYSPTVVFATETSVAVSYRCRYQEGLRLRLKYVQVLVSQVLAVRFVSGQEAATALEYHLLQLYRDVYTALRGPVLNRGSIRELGAAWKEAGFRFLDLVRRYMPEPSTKHIVEKVPKL
ncbi:hypothetical protein BDW02DRAFT_467710, partial [Decorospora gaudefroyi]